MAGQLQSGGLDQPTKTVFGGVVRAGPDTGLVFVTGYRDDPPPGPAAIIRRAAR